MAHIIYEAIANLGRFELNALFSMVCNTLQFIPGPHGHGPAAGSSRRRCRPNWSCVWLCGIGLLCGAGTPLSAAAGDEIPALQPTSTEVYYEQLRQRRLFTLAESELQAQLASAELALEHRVDLTRELARTLAEHARYVVGDEQASLWQQAGAVIDEMLEANAAQEFRPLLEVEKALVTSRRGEFLRWQVALYPFDVPLREQAQTTLRSAVGELRRLERALTDRSEAMSRYARQGASGRLSLDPFKLRRLEYRVRFRLADTLLDLAETFPPQSGERIGAVVDAEQLFRRLSGTVAEDVISELSEVKLAACERILGKTHQLDDRLKRLAEEVQTLQARQAIVTELVQTLSAEGRLDEALAVLVALRKSGGSLSGLQHFLRIRVLLESWKLARRSESSDSQRLSEELLEQIRESQRSAEIEVGGYWAWRCRELVAFATEADEMGPEIARQLREAEGLYHAGQVNESLAAYRQAETSARDAEQTAIAGEAAFTRGSILLAADRYAAASKCFAELVQQYPDSERAAEADLLKAYALGMLYDAERTRDSRLAYVAALESHRERFAESETVAESAWMQGRLEERRLQYTKALDLFLKVPADHRRSDDARMRVARCYEQILDRLKQLNRPRGEWSEWCGRAVEHLAAFVADLPPSPEPLNLTESELLVRTARVYLSDCAAQAVMQQDRYASADQLLDRAISNWRRESTTATADPRQRGWREWLQKTALQLRVLSLAGQARFREAHELLAGLATSSPHEVLQVLDGLSHLTDAADAELQRGVGELQLQTALELQQRPQDLSAAQTERLEFCLAQAYLATNQPREAVELYTQRLETHPDERETLRTVAMLQTRIGTRDAYQAAKRHWRKLESLAESGSREWLEARYNVARSCLALGEYEECRKLIGVTRLLYPGLGDPELRQRFAKLQSDANAQRR